MFFCKPKIEIELSTEHALVNDPCAICGRRCDPCGLDYVLKGTGRLVCDACAEKYAPAIVQARKEGLRFSAKEIVSAVEGIQDDVNGHYEIAVGYAKHRDTTPRQRERKCHAERSRDDVPF